MPGRNADGPDFCKISESRIENDTRLGQVPKGSNAANGKVGFCAGFGGIGAAKNLFSSPCGSLQDVLEWPLSSMRKPGERLSGGRRRNGCVGQFMAQR